MADGSDERMHEFLQVHRLYESYSFQRKKWQMSGKNVKNCSAYLAVMERQIKTVL